MFDPYLRLWDLIADGSPILTATSHLLPVKFQQQEAMLKVATCEEERRGNALMAWWNGDGAARVLAHRGDAILIERARPNPSLAALSRSGRDDSVMQIACAVLNRLHAHRSPEWPAVVPLREWFEPLLSLSSPANSRLRLSAQAAGNLLSCPPVDAVVLHGDIHHGNILYFGERGWLAIDPKGLLGERGFDYANLFCNPDGDIAVDPMRFARRAAIVADCAKLDRRRLLQWILAWSGLSALWMLEDGLCAETRLNVARLAADELERLRE
jgi:streptomycin 6-kinase